MVIPAPLDTSLSIDDSSWGFLDFMKPIQQMGHLLAANFETLIYIGMAFWATGYLNEHYPKSWSWANVTYPLGLILILRSWYVLFRSLMKSQKADENQKKESSDEKNP
jgi:hypothetical protein